MTRRDIAAMCVGAVTAFLTVVLVVWFTAVSEASPERLQGRRSRPRRSEFRDVDEWGEFRQAAERATR